MKIKINDKEIELKYSFRAIIMWEQIQEKPFQPVSASDVMVYMYCILCSSDKSVKITFDEFLDYLDANPSVIEEFTKWIIDNDAFNSQFNKKEKKTVAKKIPKK